MAAGEDASTALSPTVAARMWTSAPAWIPSTETSPAARPCSTVRVMT
jgi:hypothetical protein